MTQTDIRVLLAELYETGQKNDAETQERSKKMILPIGKGLSMHIDQP